MQIIIINAPNLNLLGTREPDTYGDTSFQTYFDQLKTVFPAIDLHYYQSNIEGEIINKLHELGFTCDGIVLNAGGYTHTSVAISDAIAAIEVPVVEVHISNVHAREDYRHHSLLAKNCKGVVTGFGLKSYEMAIDSFLSKKPI